MILPFEVAGATPEEQAAIDSWEEKAEKAAGELYLLVSQDQKVHFMGISDCSYDEN